MNDALRRARAMLRDVTPLRSDCGLCCGHRCCASAEAEATGMLLFPGEAAYYTGRPGYALREAKQGMLLMCEGSCNREDRPLSCRIFPLLPVVREDGVKVAVDFRARSVCPLARQGRSAMSNEFIHAVRESGRILCEDEVQRSFLLMLTHAQDEWKALRRQVGGERHV